MRTMKQTKNANSETVLYIPASNGRDFTEGADNLRRWYAHAWESEKVEGVSWYPVARQAAQQLAERYSLPVVVTAAVIAVLSPQMRWTQNIAAAETVIRHALAGMTPEDYKIAAYPVNKRKAHAIVLSGEIDIDPKSSPKVYSFWSNIVDPDSDFVTVDRHAIKVWLDCADGGSAAFPPSLYPKVADDYRLVARELGLSPAALQAILWVTYKRVVGR